MRLPSSFIKFTFVGGSLLIADNFAMYYLLREGIDKFISRSLIFVITIIISYFINCLFTFRANISARGFIHFILGVGVLNFGSYIISLVLMWPMFGVDPLLALNAGAAIIYLVNYFYQRSIFKKS